jgi:putative DNA primase/helicase
MRNGLVSVLYHDYQTGTGGLWYPKRNKKLTEAERAELTQRMDKAKKEREAEQAKTQEKAARKASIDYGNCKDCKSSHPYLKRKGIGTVSGLKVNAFGDIVVPLFDEHGDIVSIQRITDEGRKFNYPGAKKRGCSFPIGNSDEADMLLLSESLSTAISLHECTGHPVLVTFGKDNLMAVAQLARRRHPGMKIVVCADNDVPDSAGGENGGIEAATAAAQAVGGFVAIPEFAGGGGDYNDLCRQEGEERVRFFIEQAVKPAPPDILPPGFVNRKKGVNAGLFYAVDAFGDTARETRIGPPSLYSRHGS